MVLNYPKLISLGAMVGLTGYVLSGPVGFLMTIMLNPQPQWESSALFVQHYNIIQDVPYYFGLLLIGGMLMLAAGQYLVAKNESDATTFHLLLSVIWTTAFAALIFFNYLTQTTFIRHLALDYRPENDSIISTFSMANPRSLSWAIEMWGYGIFGVATMLMSGYYKNRSSLIRWLLQLNGIVSILTVVLTIIDVGWVLTAGGLIGYFFWNALMIVLMIVMIRYWRAIKITPPAS